MRSRGAFLVLLATLLSGASPVLAHKDDYLADTFVYVTLERKELELEYWIDGHNRPAGILHTAGAECGFTDRLMGDLSVRWFDSSGGPLAFQEGFAEIRYRFGEEGSHAVDPAASLEYSVRRDPDDGGKHRLLEPRLVLNRDVRNWNFTVNLFYAIVLDDTGRSAVEAAAGMRTPPFGRWNAGLEVHRERAVEHALLVIPQAWYRLGEDSYFKVGAGRDLERDGDAFARVAFEIEF